MNSKENVKLSQTNKYMTKGLFVVGEGALLNKTFKKPKHEQDLILPTYSTLYPELRILTLLHGSCWPQVPRLGKVIWRLHCSWKLKHLLRGYEHIVKQRLQQSPDLVSFILELKTVLEMGLKSRPECSSISPPHYYSQLISEIETLGWDKLLFIDTEFRTLRLKAEDSSGREHTLTIKLKSKHPGEAPECLADLPVPLAITWTPQSTLQQLHNQFLLVLESLTEFWNVLDEIDSQTWILEPEKPSRADTTRRIAIENNVSIKVEVDPRHPKMLPECFLLGAEHAKSLAVKENSTRRLRWTKHAKKGFDFYAFTLTTAVAKGITNFSTECGICYSYRLEAAIPDQWLRALPSSRQSFNIVFGECPYCSKPITVKMMAQIH
ncbi:E3 ubiquitin-protein ligase FANCL [Channa argus]|uniref:E3 ubiquitin-protein ligase FANCL n=1 Tax=Channa argus TaxID=215402 RepID=A0A6G1R246_CHAAH|nr:E3 ubiquitin-protein ligase FANCL [Channa argus]